MDITKTTTHLGLCAGYGGIELGLKRVIPDLRTVALCEIEAFAVANLVAKMEAGLMDAAPIWTDLKTFPWAKFRDRVDILSGGYPCQPFSAAGKRLGTEDPRHLWPYIANGIRLLRPRICFFENVEGHISLGLREVVGELESIGYKTAWGIFSASEVGAPHQRKRIFILAHRNGERGQLSHWGRLAADQVSVGNGAAWGDVWPSRPREPQHSWEPPRVVGNSNSIDRSASTEGRQHDAEAGRAGEAMGDANCTGFQERTREPSEGIQRADSDGGAHQSWQAQPTLGGDAHGPAGGLGYAELCVSCDNRTDELRLLGNGVVPATAELAFRTLFAELTPTQPERANDEK